MTTTLQAERTAQLTNIGRRLIASQSGPFTGEYPINGGSDLGIG
jgi:hypothetical protein